MCWYEYSVNLSGWPAVSGWLTVCRSLYADWEVIWSSDHSQQRLVGCLLDLCIQSLVSTSVL